MLRNYYTHLLNARHRKRTKPGQNRRLNPNVTLNLMQYAIERRM